MWEIGNVLRPVMLSLGDSVSVNRSCFAVCLGQKVFSGSRICCAFAVAAFTEAAAAYDSAFALALALRFKSNGSFSRNSCRLA